MMVDDELTDVAAVVDLAPIEGTMVVEPIGNIQLSHAGVSVVAPQRVEVPEALAREWIASHWAQVVVE